jgi:hypothetical protein
VGAHELVAGIPDGSHDPPVPGRRAASTRPGRTSSIEGRATADAAAARERPGWGVSESILSVEAWYRKGRYRIA